MGQGGSVESAGLEPADDDGVEFARVESYKCQVHGLPRAIYLAAVLIHRGDDHHGKEQEIFFHGQFVDRFSNICVASEKCRREE